MWPVNTIIKRTKSPHVTDFREGTGETSCCLYYPYFKKKKRKKKRISEKHQPMLGHQFVPDFCVFSLYKLMDLFYKSQQGIGCPVLKSWKNTNCQQKVQKENAADSPEHSFLFKLWPCFSYRSSRLKSSSLTLSFCSIVFVTFHCFQQEITFCSNSRSVN